MIVPYFCECGVRCGVIQWDGMEINIRCLACKRKLKLTVTEDSQTQEEIDAEIPVTKRLVKV